MPEGCLGCTPLREETTQLGTCSFQTPNGADMGQKALASGWLKHGTRLAARTVRGNDWSLDTLTRGGLRCGGEKCPHRTLQLRDPYIRACRHAKNDMPDGQQQAVKSRLLAPVSSYPLMSDVSKTWCDWPLAHCSLRGQGRSV